MREKDDYEIQQSWVMASQIARRIGVSAVAVGKICSSMLCSMETEDHGNIITANVGLMIKSTTKGESNPNWARLVRGIWYYNPCLIVILWIYITAFPNITLAISNSRSKYFDVKKIPSDELIACRVWTTAFRKLHNRDNFYARQRTGRR